MEPKLYAYETHKTTKLILLFSSLKHSLIFRKYSKLTIQISLAGSKDKAAAMFESVCEERISGSGGGRGSDGEEEEEDDKDADDDVWGDKTREISFGEAVASSSTPGGGKKEEEDKDMEVDEDDGRVDN